MRWFRRFLVAVLLLLFVLTGRHYFRPFTSYYILNAQHEETPVRRETSQTNSPTPTTSGATPQAAGIAGIHVVGQPALVFDHLVDKKVPDHLPDLPSTAWKEANGTVNVTVPHITNYRMRGPDLEHVVSSPNPIFNSYVSASDIVESHYNYHHWLASPYTFDGLTIYALAHTEWYACLLVGDCSDTTPPTPTSTGSFILNSWANTLNSLVSTDGGASWATNGLNEAHVVSNESFTWTGSVPLTDRIYRKATNHSGMMSPSRIIKEGSYYYSMGFLNHRDFGHIDPKTSVAPIDKYDWVLMRTTDPRQAAGWEGWVSGSTFVPLSSHGFTAFTPRSGGLGLNAGEPQIIFDTNANVYIAIFVIWGAPGSIYYVTTPSLANPVWSDAVAIGGSASLQTDPRSANPAAACSTGFQVNDYVSLIDTHSDGLNFEFTDGDPWLFYVFNPANNCGGDNLARDLYRVKLNVDYAGGPRPAFTAQPVNQQVIPGNNTQLTVTASGALTYRWQMSTNAGVSWTNLTDVPPYSGATTATLVITGATIALNGLQFRCVATNGFASAISAAATVAVARPVRGLLDLNSDGSGDVFLYNKATGARRFEVTRSGGFTESASTWDPGWQVYPANLNADGYTDFFLYDPARGFWIQALNHAGDGTFTYTLGNWDSSWTVVPSDLDGDGLTDMFVYNFTTGVWVKCFVDGGGGFKGYAVGNWDPGWTFYTADLNGDGRDDFFLYNRVNGVWVEAFSQAGFGTFDYPASGQWDPGWQVIPSDLTGDNRTDLFLLNAAGVHVSALSGASGGFDYVGGPQWAAGWSVSPGDLNGDGATDLFLYNVATGVWVEAFSDGAGNFSFSPIGTWDPGWTVAITDFNADGRGDMMLTRADGTWIQATNTAAATFTYTAGNWGSGWTIYTKRSGDH